MGSKRQQRELYFYLVQKNSAIRGREGKGDLHKRFRRLRQWPTHFGSSVRWRRELGVRRSRVRARRCPCPLVGRGCRCRARPDWPLSGLVR